MNLEMQVRLVLDEPESGVTIIKLKQTDVPEEDKYVFIIYRIISYVLNFKSAQTSPSTYICYHCTVAGMAIQLW
jgi:hypothetical protein